MIKQDWDRLISDCVDSTDPVLCNFSITRAHFLLSEALRDAIGADSGANFHSWAVWGSRKAGVTIRQEDKDQASRDATLVAGIVGALVGLAVGYGLAGLLGHSAAMYMIIWALIGTLSGGFCGFLLAGYTRRSASGLVLRGNQIVLDDIGRGTAQYLAYVSKHPSEHHERDFAAFRGALRKGRTESGGQDLLDAAFGQYELARTSDDEKQRQEATYYANCLAILHEHIRLQPLISGSMPFLIRRCVTQRLMTFNIGSECLAVHEDVPPLNDAAFPPSLMELTNEGLLRFLNGPEGWDVSQERLQKTKRRATGRCCEKEWVMW
ncbi:MAG: hypothetical protein AAGJ40_04520 [Planctomycetota bacterium]